jgi:hypothetical protein
MLVQATDRRVRCFALSQATASADTCVLYLARLHSPKSSTSFVKIVFASFVLPAPPQAQLTSTWSVPYSLPPRFQTVKLAMPEQIWQFAEVGDIVIFRCWAQGRWIPLFALQDSLVARISKQSFPTQGTRCYTEAHLAGHRMLCYPGIPRPACRALFDS